MFMFWVVEGSSSISLKFEGQPPVDLKEFLTLSRYPDESVFDLLPRVNHLILSLANVS
jgi:hypothetical protein